MPVTKSAGDPVTGATVNGNGALLIEATRVGSETALADIVRMVREAQGTRLPVQDLVDRITAIFVPAVLVVAFLTLRSSGCSSSRNSPLSPRFRS